MPDTRRDRFIRALAEFLIKDEARRSIELQMGKESAKEWADLRNASPLHGYYPAPDGLERAEKELRTFLFGDGGG